MNNLECTIRVRDEACNRVGAWWRAGLLNNHFRDHTQAPAWPEYLAACAALDKIIEASLQNSFVRGSGL